MDPFIFFAKQNRETVFLFVDDGSSDNTSQIINESAEKEENRISLLALAKNCGKGEAVRQGVLHLATNTQKQSNFIGYWDADLSTPLSAIPEFEACFQEKPGKELVCGTRIKKIGSHIERKWYRHAPGRIIATVVSALLGLPFYDTQCGAKLFRRELAVHIFSRPFFSSWLFDVEIIARIIELKGKQKAEKIMFELPLSRWTDVPGSKIPFLYLPKIPIELAQIYFAYRGKLNR